MPNKDVSTESFSEMWKATEAELLSEDSVDDTDNVVYDSIPDGGGQSDVDDGEKSVLGALVDEGQPEAEPIMYEVPGFGSFSEEELKSHLMKDKDYRQKTAELAEKRKELEAAETLWQKLQTDPVETVKKLARDVQAGIIQPAQAKVEDQSDIDEIVRQKVEEALASSEGYVDSKRERALAKVNTVFEQIESAEGVKLSQRDRNLVIEKAQELGTTDLSFVFAGLLREAEKRQAALNNAKGTSNRGSGRNEPLSEIADDPNLSAFQRAAKEALAELRG